MMNPFLYLLAFVVAVFIGWMAGGSLKLWLADLVRKREARIAGTWRRRIERGVEDIREMYADRRDAEIRRKADAAYDEDLARYVAHGRRREPTPDLLAELHRRQEAARRVVTPGEPEFIYQISERLPFQARMAWFDERADEARAKGATCVRRSVHPKHGWALLEAWREFPEKDGEPRWQVAA